MAFGAREFKLLDNITDFFESVWIQMLFPGHVGYNQKCSSFEQNDLIGFACVCKFVEMLLHYVYVRNQ